MKSSYLYIGLGVGIVVIITGYFSYENYWSNTHAPFGDITIPCGTDFLVTLDDPTKYNETVIVTELRGLNNFSSIHLLDKIILNAPNKNNESLIIMPLSITQSEAQEFYTSLKKIEHISKVVAGNSCYLEEVYGSHR